MRSAEIKSALASRRFAKPYAPFRARDSGTTRLRRLRRGWLAAAASLLPAVVVAGSVMVLTYEPARTSMRFDEHGYRGIIVPVPGHGRIAVLERGPGTDMITVERVAAKVLGAIDWTA
jgi:hypothetical protein